MIKDIFKSLNSIHKDSNLTLEEKHLLTILIKYYNAEEGYSYPTYEVLLEECSTNRRSKISKIIKGLKGKGYIEVVKVKGNKSHYYIKKHLYFIENIDSDKKQNSTDEDNAIKPLVVSDCKESGIQITIDEVVEVKEEQQVEVNKIDNHTNVRLARSVTNIDNSGFAKKVLSLADKDLLRAAIRGFKNKRGKTPTFLIKLLVDQYYKEGINLSKPLINLLKRDYIIA